MEAPMHRLIPLALILGLLFGCGPKKMSPADIATEKKAIESLVSNFWKMYEEKNLLSNPLSSAGDILIFGTDSAEVFRTVPQWETEIKNDWELFQTLNVGDLRNVSTLVANDGELGSIVCELPADMTVGGQVTHSLFRFAAAVRKEKGEWRFVHGMIAVATVGQSSAELVAKMKATPVKK
jgi:hypothetical protein